ncbi:MAG: PQQ-dependent sugar dehydrogenase [Idiomarina sp.]|nr:PQQ-dependent sugar dehydrogenase [Idiomarina sp.]
MKHLPASHLLISATFLTMVSLSSSAEDSPQVAYDTQVLVSGLAHPWGMDILPDGRFLVTEREGRLRIAESDGTLHEQPVAGLPEVWVEGQAGLFEVKLAPDYAESGQIYWTYACGTANNSSTCLARGELTESDDGSMSLHQVEELFRSSPGRTGSAHYGGRFVFMPDDTIILGLGDGFDYREQAQKPENHIGSVVRMQLDGSVPDDNPFIGLSQADPYTYSYGHRNVQGIVYDPRMDRLYTNEHGPRGGDELNIMRPGANYGWPLITSGVDYNYARITPYTELPGMTAPILEWTPSIAPSGMTQYQGDAFRAWRGDIFVSALAKKKVQRVRVAGTRISQQEDLFTELDKRIRYVYTGNDGLLYLLTDHEDGAVIRVTPREMNDDQ